jgi:hypothetical protein
MQILYYSTKSDEGIQGSVDSMIYAIRTEGPPMALIDGVRQRVRELDAHLPIANVRSLESYLSGSMARATFAMLMLVIAAGSALLLGTVGIYGVVAYIVSLRTQAIGIRMALGAQRRDVRTMVLKQGSVFIFAGIAVGPSRSVDPGATHGGPTLRDQPLRRRNVPGNTGPAGGRGSPRLLPAGPPRGCGEPFGSVALRVATESSARGHHLEPPDTSRPVHTEVGAIESEDAPDPFALGGAHQSCVGKVHRKVVVLLHQLTHTRCISLVEREKRQRVELDQLP